MAAAKELLNGYRRFYNRHFTRQDPLMAHLATRGQSPKTLVIACSDSRVDPAIIFDADPGDIFVVRNVANIVPPYAVDGGHHGTSSAVEFAVRGLNVKHVVVLGHSGCAGISALLHGSHEHIEDGFIHRWMNIAQEARTQTLAVCDGNADHPEAPRNCEQKAILISLQNLRTFPWIRERMDAGELKLHGWYFNLSNGSLSRWDEPSNEFQDVPADI